MARDHSAQKKNAAAVRGIKIWIDLDNTPHVPFFVPMIRELEHRGHKIVLSARDAFQVCELAQENGLDFDRIGHHYGKKTLMKLLGLWRRSIQLRPFLLRHQPDLALSHGSRSQIFLCNLYRIPTVVVMDYEHSRTIPLAHPRWEIVPEALSGEKLHTKKNRVLYYRGIKEDVYVPELSPDPSLLEELGLRDVDIIVTVRPPAAEAHYRNPESDQLLMELMSRVCQAENTRAVLLPRSQDQERALRASYKAWFMNGKIVVPHRAVNGLNLLWFSDLVVSGGGTMNREAAALGVPVYSIFRGPTGAVDRMLESEGRLIMIRSVDEVWTKIQLMHRDRNLLPNIHSSPALQDIVSGIEDIIRKEKALRLLK